MPPRRSLVLALPRLAHARCRRLAVAFLAAVPATALATIVIGDPVRGTAWGPGNVLVDHMDAPVAGWQPFRCDGTPGPFAPVHEVVDLVDPAGFPMPAGTWCRVDVLLEGEVVVEIDGDTITVDTPIIRLLHQATITRFKLVVTGDSGALVANVDDG